MSLNKGSLHIWDLTSGALILRNTSSPKIEHSLHSKLLLCGISEDNEICFYKISKFNSEKLNESGQLLQSFDEKSNILIS